MAASLINAATSTNVNDPSYGVLFNPWDDLFLAGRGALAADFRVDPPITHFDSPEFISVLAWLDEMNQAGAFLRYDDEQTQLQHALIDGKVAFWTLTLSDPGDLFGGQPPTYQVGLAPLPIMPVARFVSWGSKGHFISSQASDPQACWDWITYLSEQVAVFKGLPARLSVAESPAWEAVVGSKRAAIYRQALKNALQSAANTQPYSPISWPLIFWQSQAVTAMLDGGDYQALLPVLQHKATTYLTCMEGVDRTLLTTAETNQEVRRCARESDPDGNWGR